MEPATPGFPEVPTGSVKGSLAVAVSAMLYTYRQGIVRSARWENRACQVISGSSDAAPNWVKNRKTVANST